MAKLRYVSLRSLPTRGREPIEIRVPLRELARELGEATSSVGRVSGLATWKKSRRRFGASGPRRSNCRRLRLGRRGKQPKGVIDTSVLVAGVAGFKSRRTVENPSASLLRRWLDDGTVVWLVTEDILSEYKEVLSRLRVRLCKQEARRVYRHSEPERLPSKEAGGQSNLAR